MEKLVLIGGGGHCKSVLDAALRSGEYDRIVISDPLLTPGDEILGCTVAGNDEILPKLKGDGFTAAFITVGSVHDSRIREKLVLLAEKIGFRFPVISDPAASISEFARIGEGTFIGKNVVVNAEAKIGRHCILNTGCIVEHECLVGDFTHISVGSVLCGNVRVGERSFVGAGSTVIQGRTIGAGTVIGAGSLVLTDVGDSIKACGIIKNRGI